MVHVAWTAVFPIDNRNNVCIGFISGFYKGIKEIKLKQAIRIYGLIYAASLQL